DESVNEHWSALWEEECKTSSDKRQCAYDEGIPSRTIEYWDENPEEAPEGFPSKKSDDSGPGYSEDVKFTLAEGMFEGGPALDNGSLAWADVNRNGRLDVAVSGVDSNNDARLVIFKNLGDGEFQIEDEPMGDDAGLYSSSIAWGDFDNSGRLDLAVMGHDKAGEDASPRLIVFRNNGDFDFENLAEPMEEGAGLERGKLIPVDFNNDGKMDIIASGHDGSVARLIVFANTTGGEEDELAFDEGTDLVDDNGDSMGLSNFSAVAAWDYNRDGWPDLAALGQDRNSDPRLVLWENMGPDTPVYGETGFIDLADTIGPVQGLLHGDLSVADILGDGSPELIAAGKDDFDGTQFYVIASDGNSFSLEQSARDLDTDIMGLRYASLSAGDFNNSGKVDVIISGRDMNDTNRLLVYKNDDGKLQRDFEPLGRQEGLTGGVAGADFRGDGKLGFAALGFDGADKQLYGFRNNTDIEANEPPDIPETIGTERDSNTVIFRWKRSDDDRTSSESLSYIIRVGSTPGGVDVLGEGSTDEHRYYHKLQGRIPPGRTEAILHNLPSGSYHWAVRAIDGGYQMSEWSDEESFDF
ncbi:MAG: FG-GAP repeat domain-containing protein, partial [bacterium]